MGATGSFWKMQCRGRARDQKGLKLGIFKEYRFLWVSITRCKAKKFAKKRTTSSDYGLIGGGPAVFGRDRAAPSILP
jgi:hypothetical protein